LRIDGKGLVPSAFADNAQRIISPVLVQVADFERGNLR
jgi:hypothetical protein